LTLVVLQIFIFSSPGIADLLVTPAEGHISMNNDFIEGNTGKKITVINTYPYDVIVKAVVKNPDPEEWRRPGRTNIDNISWITVKPQQDILLAYSGKTEFYIYLDIPKVFQKNCKDKHWEVWIAISEKPEQEKTYNIGYLVRVYIDTPPLQHPLHDIFASLDWLKPVIILAIIFGAIVIFFILNKKT